MNKIIQHSESQFALRDFNRLLEKNLYELELSKVKLEKIKQYLSNDSIDYYGLQTVIDVLISAKEHNKEKVKDLFSLIHF